MDVHKSPRVAKRPRVATHDTEDPPFNILARFINWGYVLGCSLTQWVKVRIANQALVHLHKRVKSSDLIYGQFLGEGCSGIIYKATWSRRRNTSLLARKAFPAVPVDVFESEAARLVELHHPNIVEVLGWTVDRRSCSLVMDHMKYDLFSVVEKKKEAMRYEAQVNFRTSTVPIPLRDAVYIMSEIAEGMKYVHDQGLAHGDLKPSNVLVDLESNLEFLRVRVTDFGLTKTKKRSTTLVSHQARCLQILKWKSPKLFEDLLDSSIEDSEDNWIEMFPNLEVVKTSHASSSETMGSAKSKMQLADVYSFALTCSYILGAQVPYDSSLDLSELRYKISSGARPHIHFKCPKTLASLISRCWDPIPSHRPTFIDICKEMRAIQLEFILNEDIPRAWRGLDLETDAWDDTAELVRDEYLEQQRKVDNLKALPEWEHFFFDLYGSRLEIKGRIAGRNGGDIYEGEWKRDDGKFHSVVIKTFTRKNFPIPEAVLHFFSSKGPKTNLGTSRVLRPLGGTFLKNGRFALVYERYWGDLYMLINFQTQKKKVPPFKQEMAIEIMLQIAKGLAELHEFGLVHKDVKSRKVLVHDLEKFSTEGNRNLISCALIGYEDGD